MRKAREEMKAGLWGREKVEGIQNRRGSAAPQGPVGPSEGQGSLGRESQTCWDYLRELSLKREP